MGRLADLAAPLLSAVARIREPSTQLPPEAQLRAQLVEALEQLYRGALDLGFNANDAEDTRYALVAALDEAIQNSGWPARMSWTSYPLQQQLYDDRNAGDGFFQRLRGVEGRSREVAEVYFLCLALGFRGRFALVGGRELDPWLDRLAQPLAVEPTPLAIPGRGQADVDETALARRRPFWLVPAIVLAVALVAHLGLGFALSSDVDALASKGRALRSQQGGAP